MRTTTQTTPQIRVTVAAKGMEVRLRWSPPDLPIQDLLVEFSRRAPEMGVTQPLDEPAVRKRIDAARAKPAAGGCEACVLNGTPPAATVDEALEWAREFFNAPYKVNEQTGTIDYRERVATSQIGADELVATVRPGVQGAPGSDVFGRPVQARPVRKAGLLSGRNIRFEPGTRQFFAKSAGRLRFSGKQLAVDDTLDIPGSVGLATGNVHFTGQVSVARDIEDLAIVEADGGVDVANVIGMARVTSGGNVHVGKGIAGKDRGQVTAAGGIVAGYIANALVQAEGDIEVHREIVRCEVRCRGNVQVPTGRIVGGSVTALGQIVTAEAGSEAGVPTLLAAGEDYTLSTALAEQQTKLSVVAARAEQLRSQVDRMVALGRRMSAQQREALTDLMFQAQGAEAALAECQRHIDQQVLDSDRLARRVIVVSHQVHPGVTLRIDGVAMAVTQTIPGPIRVSLVQGENGPRLSLGR